MLLAVAVTCLLSLIPLKIPALAPFWLQHAIDSLAASPSTAAAPDHLDDLPDHVERPHGQVAPIAKLKRRGARLDDQGDHLGFNALNPLSPQSGERHHDPKPRLDDSARLYAGIRANARIPAKRVRQIALPPPTPFHLRAPPARA